MDYENAFRQLLHTAYQVHFFPSYYLFEFCSSAPAGATKGAAAHKTSGPKWPLPQFFLGDKKREDLLYTKFKSTLALSYYLFEFTGSGVMEFHADFSGRSAAT